MQVLQAGWDVCKKQIKKTPPPPFFQSEMTRPQILTLLHIRIDDPWILFSSGQSLEFQQGDKWSQISRGDFYCTEIKKKGT